MPPVIKVNSSTGAAPPLASGAGPGDGTTSGSVLTGTNASFSASVITLDGSPSLTNVVTNGDHVIYLGTSTGRKFFAITAKDDVAKTVTVADAPAGTSTGRSWAIGGKINGAWTGNGYNLLENGGAAGDAKGGWIVEMESGHTETTSGEINIRAAGDATSGAYIVRGTAGAPTRPVVQFSGADTRGIIVRGDGLIMQDFTIRSTGTKAGTNNFAIQAIVDSCTLIGMTIDSNNTTNRWYAGTGGRMRLIGCSITQARTDCVRIGDTEQTVVIGCYLKGADGYGIRMLSGWRFGIVILNNVFDANVGGGIYIEQTRSDWLGVCQVVAGNTFLGATGVDSILNATADATAFGSGTLFLNNIFSASGGFDIRWSNVTGGKASLNGGLSLYNNSHSATSGHISPTANLALNQTTLDPQFTASGSGNFSVGTNMRAIGYPSAIGAAVNYLDLGAVQRQEPAGGTAPAFVRGANTLLRM